MNSEGIARYVLFLFAISAVLILFTIIAFLFKESMPVYEEIGIVKFLTGTEWSSAKDVYGALPFILASIIITFGALLISVPFGLACAIFMVEIAPKRAGHIIRPAIELLAGIPSIVYGLFALTIIVGFLKIDSVGTILSGAPLSTGEGILAASLILAIMILPVIISISHDAIESVPKRFKEGSIAKGATDWQTIRKIILPSASPGIIASIILGTGRAIGETMAVVLVLGNAKHIPNALVGIESTGEALTSVILLEMGEAVHPSLHYSALCSLAMVLFIMVLLLSLISTKLQKKK